MNKHTPQWYVANMGNDHQGLVVDEVTGRNVAVAYDRKDTPMLAAAPAMYEALKGLLGLARYIDQSATHEGLTNCDLLAKARQALTQAEGKP